MVPVTMLRRGSGWARSAEDSQVVLYARSKIHAREVLRARAGSAERCELSHGGAVVLAVSKLLGAVRSLKQPGPADGLKYRSAAEGASCARFACTVPRWRSGGQQEISVSEVGFQWRQHRVTRSDQTAVVDARREEASNAECIDLERRLSAPVAGPVSRMMCVAHSSTTRDPKQSFVQVQVLPPLTRPSAGGLPREGARVPAHLRNEITAPARGFPWFEHDRTNSGVNHLARNVWCLFIEMLESVTLDVLDRIEVDRMLGICSSTDSWRSRGVE